MSTATLLANAIDEDEIAKSPLEVKIKELQKKEKAFNEEFKGYYERYQNYTKLYRERKISEAAFYDSGKNFNRQQDTISARKKLVSEELDDLKDLKSADQDRQRQIENFVTGSKSYTGICTAGDTMNGKWYGMLSSADLEKPDTRFQYRSVYTETARNKFYSAVVTVKDPSRKAVELLLAEPEKLSDAVYLQGGLLFDKATALPIHLSDDSGFLVCYKEKVGYQGNIMLARIDLKGTAKWSMNTKLSEFLDWIYTGKRLIILGVDNKELSSDEANLLMIIDLQNGTMITHDYFTDKMRK